MISVGLISWWYGEGLKMRYNSALEKTAELADFFSISILINTLFSPYKQISANEQAGSVGEVANVLFDKFISRFIGFMARLIIIVVGAISLFVQQIIHFITIICWVAIPLMPVIGLVLMFSGWSLSWII